MRRRQLKWLWARLKQLSTMKLTREELLMKLGAAREQSPTAWRLVTIEIAAETPSFSYLPRSQQTAPGTPARRPLSAAHQSHRRRSGQAVGATICSWSQSRKASKTSKGDLSIRPIFHQLEARIEAHVFIAFLAYCLHVTLARRLHAWRRG